LSTNGVIIAIIAATVVLEIYVNLKRYLKSYEEYLAPELNDYGFKFISSKTAGLFQTGPFPKFEIRITLIYTEILGIMGEYRRYRIVRFQDKAGVEHEAWVKLDFSMFKLESLEWKPSLEEFIK